MEIKPLQETLTGYGNFLLYGASGAGKTRSIATMPKGTVLLSADSGRRTLKDIAPQLQVGVIETLDDLRDSLKLIKDFKYVVIDDLTVISKVVLNDEKSKTKDGRQAYMKMQEVVDKIIQSFFDLPQTVIFVAQEERVNQEDAGLFDYVYCPSVPGKKFSASIPYLFDYVFAMRTKNEEVDTKQVTKRRFQTALNGLGDYLAKSRTERLSLYEEANWVSIFNKLNDGE
jgi:hypothetical protein